MSTDAHGTVLKRHDCDGVDTGSPQRVRFTHKQLHKRTDLRTTDDTVGKRANLSEAPSSSSSSHEIVPKLLDSSCETADADLGERARKKIRVDVDVEISAIENIDECQAGSRSSTRHCKHDFPSLMARSNTTTVESEAVTEVAELQSIKDKGVYTEAYESDKNEKVISGKWKLKPNKARYVLRGF